MQTRERDNIEAEITSALYRMASKMREVPAVERLSRDLVKRIRKLHWIGLEEEARELEDALRGIAFGDPPLYMPRDTD